MTTTRDIAARRRLATLEIADRIGGWITPGIIELTVFAGAKPEVRNTYAQKLLASMFRHQLMVRRALPGQSHMIAGATTKLGAVALTVATCIEATPATSWGTFADGTWRPPASWEHDLRAARFLFWAAGPGGLNGNWEPYCERELRRVNGSSMNGKVPDGVLVNANRKLLWVEAEHSRKTGYHRKDLVHQLALNSMGQAVDPIWLPRHPRRSDDLLVPSRSSIVVGPAGYDPGPLIRACQRHVKQCPHHRVHWQLATEAPGRGYLMQRQVDVYGRSYQPEASKRW